ncbi:YbaB/EbfC family nucleoid-associated protein [Curtanaerobium respiraculi]|uniref:YbaB/EbfC family nucleoid-associated protein n=1 Tax=Curtanaerobium respiraculi TaxID=2949669 RepID=UPI0024B39E5D|nr:YbaB/EbfC family nucleoid-associated protein [Curtanaerobium respiraculi]
MDMKKMMRQAQRMQAQLAQAQEEIKTLTYEGTAGGGMVRVTVTGEMEVQKVEISPVAIDPDDPEMLQDMIMAATNDALRGMNELSSTRLSAVTAGMPNIPGMTF